MKRTSFAVFLVIFFLAFAECTLAQGTYGAATCNYSDVNAVVNGPTHTALNGDIIQIPAGSCTWSSILVAPAGVGITITGSGTPNSTPSTFGPSASCTATAITVSASHMIELRPDISAPLSRISCMKLLQGSSSIGAPLSAAGACNSSTCPSVRIDNVTFDSSLQGHSGDSGSQVLSDNIFGVIDHNSMASPSNGMEFLSYNHSAWKGVGDFGDNSYTSADSFGTAQNMYIENNAFGNGGVLTETEAQVPFGNEGGGRVVVRFNSCNGCIVGLSNHGTDSNGRPRGARQGEFYGNSFLNCNTASGCQAVGARSGVYMIFGNTLSQTGSGHYNSYFDQATFRVATIWSTPWNQCPGPYDQTSPLICTDQVGRSGGTLLSGVTPSATGWTNEVIDPSYEWNDSGPVPAFGTVTVNEGNQTANRDFFTDNSNGTPHIQTSSTSPFNGSSGVGFGTSVNRPTSCTLNSGSGAGSAGVGYWVTN